MSNLLKFAKVQKNEDFISRVSAAMLIQARYLDATDADLSVPAQQLVEYVQANPMVPVPDMVLTAAVNGTVVSKVNIALGVADATEVPDTDIEYVVGAEWSNVAARVFPPA